MDVFRLKDITLFSRLGVKEHEKEAVQKVMMDADLYFDLAKPARSDNIADTIRSRHRLHGKIRALTAQGKWQAALICSLPPVLGIVINAINPQLMEPVYSTIYGWILIAAIVVLQILGIVVILKIVNIDV